MSKKRQTLEIGAGGGGSGYSLFYKDETANLAAMKDVLFYQTWGLGAPAEPPPPEMFQETWASMDYDRRWTLTVKLYPSALDQPRACPLQWPELEIALWWWNWAKVS
jgi:hypothetical protein